MENYTSFIARNSHLKKQFYYSFRSWFSFHMKQCIIWGTRKKIFYPSYVHLGYSIWQYHYKIPHFHEIFSGAPSSNLTTLVRKHLLERGKSQAQCPTMSCWMWKQYHAVNSFAWHSTIKRKIIGFFSDTLLSVDTLRNDVFAVTNISYYNVDTNVLFHNWLVKQLYYPRWHMLPKLGFDATAK